jgi:hypothetical protein
MVGFRKTQLQPTLHVCLCRLCPMSSGTELSSVVFGQHVRPIFILVIFSSEVVWRSKFTTVTPGRKKNQKKIFLGKFLQNSCRTSFAGASKVYVWDTIFNTFCDLWIVTTSFRTLSANRHIDSAAKFVCAGRREAQSREQTNKGKNRPLLTYTSFCIYI